MSENKVIVYIDDEPFNLELVERTLRKIGYEVLSASDADSGIDLIEAHDPALVLMDIHMNRVNGIQATEFIKSNPQMQHIPIVALTADHGDDTRRIALDSGCSAYVTKPIQREVLFKVIQQMTNPNG